jgi:competence protein ComEC
VKRLALGPAVGLGAVVSGIALGEHLGPGTGLIPLVLGVASALRAPRQSGFAILALLLIGTACTQRALHGLSDSRLPAMATEGRHVRVTGSLVEDPEVRFHTAGVVLRLGRVDGMKLDRRVLVVASGDIAGQLGVLAAGDRVSLEGSLEPLDGYDARYHWRHAVVRLRADALIGFADARGLDRIANALRDATLRGLDALAPSDRALAASFLLGDDRSVPSDVKAEFRAAGLSHLLVVSGANVAFALALAMPLLHRVGLRGRLVGGVAVLVVFGTMTRWEPSVLRAVAMAVLVLVGRTLGRPLDALRALLLGTIVLLIVDPFLVHSLGFRLSCAASAGIALLAGPLASRIPGPRTLREAAAATIGAEVGVTPVLLPTFGSVPLVALPANLLAAPAVGVITAGGLAAGVVGGLVRPALPGLAVIIAAPVGVLVRYEALVARVAAIAPIAVDGRSLVLIAAVGVVAALSRRARRLRGDGSRSPRHDAGARRRHRRVAARRRRDH